MRMPFLVDCLTPVDFLVVLVEGELRGREFPELREVELELFALIVEAAEELSRERDVVDDRAAADVKGRVLSFLPVMLEVRLHEDSQTHGVVKSRPQFLSS